MLPRDGAALGLQLYCRSWQVVRSPIRVRFFDKRRYHCYHSVAIARSIPDSFQTALAAHTGNSSSSSNNAVCMETARQQHKHYVHVLRSLLPVLELPALEEFPDCSFVEDTAVVIDGGMLAVIARPGHASRQGEVDSVKEVLEQFGIEIVDMRSHSPSATCDGGDVLLTGRHLFVGLSNRTNQEGADFLQRAFGETMQTIVVPAVVQGSDVLHLKSATTHLDSETLLLPTGAIGDQILAAMKAEQLGYKIVRLPDVLACNAVAVGGTTILAQDTKCQESRRKLEDATKDRNLELIFVNTSELAKKDAALTCCSVLI
jgi:dimethylargininase